MPESDIWKDVVGFEGYYKVSNQGNVHSVERRDARGQKRGGQMLKPKHHRDGYLCVSLYKNGKQKNKKIHRLVAETFIPNPNNFPQVNHIDEIKDNNNVKNLEWCTSRYNNNYGTKNIRISQKKSKKVRAINIKTGEVLTFNSVKEAEKKGYYNISQACRGIYYGGNLYRNHHWYYEEEEINERPK